MKISLRPLTTALAALCAAAVVSASAADLFDPAAPVRKLAGGFKFTEGPAVDKAGNVYFSDIPNERILKWSVEGKLSIFRENSGGANGLYFAKDGRLYACEGNARRLTATDMEGNVTVLTDSYLGKKYNSPNDLWIDPEGGVYFTDPRYGRVDDSLEQGGFHVYYRTPDGRMVVRVIEDFKKPNGIVGTRDGKRLYVADHGGSMIYSYDIDKGGTLKNRKIVCTMGSDGMTLDEKENVYITAGGKVHIYSSIGAKVGEIEVPEPPANVVFGGPDRKTLFITARTSLYAKEMKVKGQ